MDDLHKPLGQKPPIESKRNWVAIAVGCVAVGLISVAAYVFIDAKSTGTTVVALNAEPSSKVQPSIGTPSVENSSQPPTTDEPFDINKVKPLSPLEPLPEESQALLKSSQVSSPNRFQLNAFRIGFRALISSKNQNSDHYREFQTVALDRLMPILVQTA